MTTSIQPREEVFPGYLLTERIGSGGYAEVWRARAPGGIDKAVKIVYGYYDDQLAAQEMKAMERIKDVRHPFVLSLERFEVVDGRLAILTELADMSLEQRAQQCRAQGLPGIPRDELLRFMADTAEALDYLAQRHSLQHLDIKPANLLISGDHVKVADFGLVKELASRTQNSMVAGMTPTYSSPEMFDDAPSPQSDQYSLAIVYQELLTGVLPFPGRTAAQLANQHLRSQPQLAALAESDRSAVARALAKNPAERFPSCRAFVSALSEAVDPSANRATAANKSNEQIGIHGHDGSCTPVTTMPRVANAVLQSSSSASASKATQPTEVQPHGTIDTKADLKRAAKVRPREDIVDVAAPDVAAAVNATQPTLYIAVGGVGIRILCRLRDLLARRANASQNPSAAEMIAIDTDRSEIRDACSTNWSNPLPSPDALCLSLRLPQEYRDQGRCNLEWLSHRWLYNIPRSLETRGYRPLGRLALVDHVDKALSLIDRKLEQLAANHTDYGDQHEPPEIRVVLLAGMGGGTGGGMAIDLANAARSRIQVSGRRAQIQAVFICTCLGNISASPLSLANTYALLTELQFVSAFGNRATQGESSGLQSLESCNRPFDLVYCVPTKHRAEESVDDELFLIAKQLSLASTDGVRQMLQCCQQAATPRELGEQESLLLRTFGSASLAGPEQNRIEIDQMSADSPFEAAKLDCIITTERLAAVDEALGRHTTGAAIHSNPTMHADAQQTLERANVDLLQCGYDRRTLIVVPLEPLTKPPGTVPFFPDGHHRQMVAEEKRGLSPSPRRFCEGFLGNKTSEAIDALNRARPTATFISANVDESLIVCEGSGISPSSLLQGLERVYPGIAEAAGRLFTRTDIDWSA